MQQNIIALILSYVYVFTILILGQLLARFFFHGSNYVTRKFVHIGVGMWVFPTVVLFTTWQWAIIPPLTFIVLNYVSYRREVFTAMESADKSNLGTVYFPISLSLIIAAFWAKPEVVAAGMMPMVWGDSLAAIVGHKWGSHPITFGRAEKTWEGSAVMLAASFVAVLLALLAFGVTGGTAVLAALIVAVVATVVELLTPFGMDNLAVPLVSAVVLWLML